MYTRLIFRSLVLMVLVSGLSSSIQAQKRGKKPVPKKGGGKSVPAASSSAPSKPPKEMKWVYGDAFIGPSFNFVNGEYLDYQKFYYQTANPNFDIQGQFSDLVYFTAGGQIRVYPFRKAESWLSGLGFSTGASFLKKGFTHKIQLLNQKGTGYPDETRLTEEFEASFLSTHLMARYGKRLFLEAGIAFDCFLAGYRSQEIVRTTSSDAAYLGAFETRTKLEYDLTSKTMANFSPGWVFGIGYQFGDLFGLRWFNNYNTGFFKDGADLGNFQTSLQVNVSLAR